MTRNLVFMDECSFKTHKSGLFINRRPTRRPKSSGICPRNVKTLHVIAGISYSGPVFLKVILN